jgi:peptidoglycan/LPS O-acetylase OafA/YrhL
MPSNDLIASKRHDIACDGTLGAVAKYGYLGVELFFMISGFVILMTASNGDLRRFISSRVVRLYPAFWMACVATFLVTLVWGAPRFSASWEQWAVNMTLMAEFFSVPSIDGAYWSLYVELRFYLLVALVLWFGGIARAEVWLWLWLAMTVLLDLYPVGFLSRWFLTSYAPFFISGAAFFLIWQGGSSWRRWALIGLSFALALAHALGELAEFDRNYRTTMNAAVVAGLITLFYGVMAAVSLRRTGRFGHRTWPLAGALTYPLYLLHQNIGYITFHQLHGQVNHHVLLWGTVLGMIGLAYAVHKGIEKPLAPRLKKAMDRLLPALPRVGQVRS